MRQLFYYKMRQLSQIVTILLQNATVVTKCHVYYKLRQYTHNFAKLLKSVDKVIIFWQRVISNKYYVILFF